MSNPDTFNAHGVGYVDITPEYGGDPVEKFPRTPQPLIRVYWSDRLGRRSKRQYHRADYSDEYGIMIIRRELAFDGQVEVPEARLWGKIIHGIGTEEGIMTVHLRPRYME